MTERNPRERPSTKHDSTGHPPTASTPSSFLSRVFRGSVSRSSTSEQSVPTSSQPSAYHGDPGKLHPSSPSITSSSGTGPSPGISPILSPQLPASSVSKRSRSKSPNRARQRLHDISTITGLSLHEETEDDEGESTSVGILRHLSQTAGTGLSRNTTTSRRSARPTNHTALRELITTLVNEDDEGPLNNSRLSNHERASLAVELAAELRIKLEDLIVERRLRASLVEEQPASTTHERSATSSSPRGTLQRMLSSVIGSGTDIDRVVDSLMRLPPQLIVDGDRTKLSSGQNLKMAGFQLLAVLLQLQYDDVSSETLALASADSYGDIRFKSNMIELCLQSPIDVPSQAFNTPLATFEYAIGDLPDRIACLRVLTHHGRDISLNQDIVRTLVRWHHIMLNGWKNWCADPGSWESINGTEDIADAESRGRRHDQAYKSGANERDHSGSTVTIHLKQESDTLLSDDSDAPVIVRSLINLWNCLVAIVTYNFPLFSGRDIETIIDMAVTMIHQGIEATSLNTAPASFPRTESHPPAPPVPSPKNAGGSRARSGSLLGKNRMLKVPAPPPTTSETGLSQASTMLSRSPSMKTRDGRAVSNGSSPLAVRPAEARLAAIAGASGNLPPWSRVLEPVFGLLHFLLEAKYLPPTSLVQIIQLFALCYGWRSDARFIGPGVRPDDSPISILNNLDNISRTRIEQFIKDLFASRLVSRNAERCLRSLLAGAIRLSQDSEYESRAEFKRDILIGALGLTRVLLQTTYAAAQEKNIHVHELSPNFNLQSLAPTLLSIMSAGKKESTDSGEDKSTDVDVQVLSIVDDYLTDLSCATIGSTDIEASTTSLDTRQANSRDPWYEGHLICQFLQRGLALAKGSDIVLDLATQSTSRTINDPVALKMSLIMCRLPSVLGGLQSGPSAGVYLHTEFVNLLMQIPADLDNELALRVIDFYKREGLCLPPHSDWIDNINKVMEAFFVGHHQSDKSTKREIRSNAASLLFEHVYDYVQDFSESRTQLVGRCILPILERTLAKEEDESVADMAWETLISAAVLETVEEDERRRVAQKTHVTESGLSAPVESLPLGLPGSISSYSARMRRLIMSIGCNETCQHNLSPAAHSHPASRRTTAMSPQQQPDDRVRHSNRNRSGPEELHSQSPDLSASVSSSTIRDIMGSFSPTFFSANRDVPPISQSMNTLPAAVTRASVSAGKHAGDVPEPRSPADRDFDRHNQQETQSMETCKAVRSVKALIAIWTRLAFSLPRSLRADTLRLSRLPASTRCIVIFADMLQMLWPKYVASHHAVLAQRDAERSAQIAEWHLTCQHARLLLLQWFVRLRANKQHRIWIKPFLDDGAEPMADLLGRSGKKIRALAEDSNVQGADEAVNRRRKPMQEGNQTTPSASERGRIGRAPALDLGAGRSRSRSRQPQSLAQATITLPYRPIWQIPHSLEFEVPPDARPSEGMTTYDPSVSDKDAEPIEDVWIPISDYMSVVVAMLAEEKDWELVSYLLIFLPLQLANKHLFCGPKSSQAIRQLRRLICDGLLSGSFLSHVRLPIRPSEVLPTAYQMLSLFISYKSLFNKGEIGAIVDVLVKGLQGQTTEIMRSSIQTLTVAVHEVTDSVSQHLNSILELLANLITKGKVSIHALEFLNAVGSVPSLYANFTDEQYLTVFKVAIAYIQLHHQRTKDAEETISDQDKGDFTESQHVITMSYHAIYVWFLALSLDKRPTVVPFLSRNLMHAFTDGRIDEMAEVCYDWLARYTYGNADPKPTPSYLGEVVMNGDPSDDSKQISENVVAKSWLLGNTVLTIKTQPRSGWVVVTAVRPSGTVSLLTKVENVPLLGLGEDNADLNTLPAVLMADRRQENDVYQKASDKEDDVLQQASSSHDYTARLDPGEAAERRQSADYIWAGVSPSQRRKDVAILPGFVGLQLSAYPYVSLDAPRGRLIPPDDRRLQVMIRNLDYIPIIDSHSIAVLYVGPGQKDEVDIFSNTDGSPAFLTFMAGLGRLIRLRGQKDVYTGGLDTHSDEDGEYAYAWWDDLSQSVFHAPHLMPNRPVAEGQKEYYSYKKRHVGNDYVHIVFNNSGEDYKFDTISTQFRFVNIVISAHTAGVSGSTENPSEHDFFKVTIQKKAGIPEFSPIGDFKLVSAKALPVLVRQIALSANVMAQVFNHVETQGNMPYLTPWRQRYRTIQRIKDSLPPLVHGDDDISSDLSKMELLRDFTRQF